MTTTNFVIAVKSVRIIAGTIYENGALFAGVMGDLGSTKAKETWDITLHAYHA
jgi:hypothetical protein